MNYYKIYIFYGVFCVLAVSVITRVIQFLFKNLFNIGSRLIEILKFREHAYMFP